MKTKKQFFTHAMAAAVMCASLGGGLVTHAATNAQTPVTLVADDSRLSITVPTIIPLTMDAAGVLQSASVAPIKNNSNFAIHVKSVKVDAVEPFTIVADAAQATADNAVDFQFGVAGHLIDAKAPVPAKGFYNMESKGGADTLAMTAGGNAKNVKADIASAQQIANITWTFAAGQAK